MLDGMKMATLGMMAMATKQDVLANNLANVGTAGYRKDNLVISSFSEILSREMGLSPGGSKDSNEYMQASIGMDATGMLFQRTATQYAQGSLRETGNNFDLALDDNGKGFFTIQTQEGIKFTRAGSFRLNTNGYLVTQDGSFLLGHKGPIQVKGTSFEVTNEGIVRVDGKEADKILVTTFDDRGVLNKVGDSNFIAASGGRISVDSKIKQGYLEMSNVNAVKEMVDMLTIMRTYEANQKMLQTQDHVLQKAANELGKIK